MDEPPRWVEFARQSQAIKPEAFAFLIFHQIIIARRRLVAPPFAFQTLGAFGATDADS